MRDLFGMTRREALSGLTFGAGLLSTGALSGCAGPPDDTITGAEPWDEIVAIARGRTVNWSAWAGDPKINAFIAWVGERVRERFGIALVHAKLSDTAILIQQLLADKTAGRTAGGRTDLVWINGENFIAARELGLLWGPFAERLPNWRYVDTEGKPSTVVDFTVPVEGYESPWGMAQLTFFYDAARLSDPPRSIPALLDFAAQRPGRLTYPAPPDFTGVTFLKQALIELTADRSVFTRQADDATFTRITAPLWAYLDQLHPMLWRSGRAFPPDYPSLRQLLEDREVDLAFSFNPAEASNAVASGLLPDTIRAYIFDGGTIQNSHFVAIPFNAPARAASMVVADFLLSPEAQARKADPQHWGDATVLNLAALPAGERRAFEALPPSPHLPDPASLTRQIAEPHPSWHEKLAESWRARYAA